MALILWKVEWRSAIVMCGARYVMISGVLMMLLLFVDSSDFSQTVLNGIGASTKVFDECLILLA